MAEFGVQATELSAPQGAGASVIRPATAQMDLSGIGSIFKAIGGIQESKAEQERQRVLKEYTTNRDKYAQAIEAGGDLSTINAKRRADASRFRANNPGLIKDFDIVDKSFMENTAISDADEEVKLRNAQRKNQIEFANSLGYPITPNTSKETLDQYAALAQSVRSANASMEAKTKQLTFETANFNYGKNVEEERRKDFARNMLSEIVPTHLVTVNSVVKDMSIEIANNPESYNTNMLRLRQLVNGLTSQLAITKESLPGVYESFQSMMDDVVTNAEKFLNPTSKTENALKLLTDQNKLVIERAKSVIFQKSPGSATLAATTQLLGDNVLTQLQGAEIFNNTILSMIDPNKSATSVPPIVAKPKEEQIRDFSVATAALENAVKANTPESISQGKRLMENILEQARVLDLQENITLDQIAPIVDFLSNPTTRSKLETLKVSPEKMNGMVSIMERYYYAQVQPAINDVLSQTIKVGSPVSIAARGMLSAPERKDVSLATAIHIEPSPTGIKVVPKNGSAVDVKSFVKNMEVAVSKGLQAESNLTGKSVEQVWAEKAHIFFPGRYPPNFTLKPGDKVPGTDLIYVGGFPIGDETSYRKSK